MVAYSYILGTVVFTVYGQLILKWRIGFYGELPPTYFEKFMFIFHLLIDPFILSGLISAFIAALFWMAAMTKFDLSHAYPFMAINFVLVLILSGLLFNEAITMLKVIGISLVVIGIFVGSQG